MGAYGGAVSRRRSNLLLNGSLNNEEEGFMRKLTMTLSAAALMLGTMAIAANAAPYQGNSGFRTQIQNATPIEKAACRGFGRWCGPGFVRACGPYRCWCRPCY